MSLPLKITPKSICIIRLSAIGDVTHMLPIIHTLQTIWPLCKITWVIGKLEATLVGDLPNVEFIIFDKTKGASEYLQFRKTIAQRRFDVLLHMQVALRASLISLLVSAPIRLGFDKARAHDYQWLFTKQRINACPEQHVLDGFFEFLNALGISEKVLSWDIPVPIEAENFASKHLSSNMPVLAINPCSSHRVRNWRNWPAEKYAAVAQHAATQLGMQIVLTGGPGQNELQLANDICQLTTAPITNLAGKTTLKEMLAVLKRSTVLISPDTGPAHMGTAAGIPVIGLYASSNPKRTGPYLSLKHVVNQYAQAMQQYGKKNLGEALWGERVRHADAMNLITAEEVITKLSTLVEGTAALAKTQS